MGSLNKKEGIKLVAKTLVATSVIGTGAYYIDIPNMSTIIAYADTSTTSNIDIIKNKILTGLQNYQTDITFTPSEYTSLGIVKDTDTDPKKVFFKVLDEHPEIFWVAQNVIVETNDDGSGNKSAIVHAINLYENDKINIKKSEINSKIDSLKSKFSSYSSDLRKVYEIHDYINSNIIYDHDVANATVPESPINPNSDFAGYLAETRQIAKNNASYYEAHSLYGALIKGKAVCEGYAKIAKILLNNSGIESELIKSNTHGWNYVKIDGKYYQLDTTWDDQSDEKTLSPYKYFNITNTEMLQDTSSNKALHTATSGNVPNCSDSTYDNIFRTVSGGVIEGNNVVRLGEKLYGIELNGSNYDLYSSDLNGSNKIPIKSAMKFASNAFAYKGNVYFFERLDVSPYVIINKLNTTTNEITQFVDLYADMQPTGGFNYSFYIKDDVMTITLTDDKGTTTKTYSTIDTNAEAINLSKATQAVEKAESSKTKEDVNSARNLVDILSNSSNRSSLISRLDVVQAYINSLAGQTTTGAAVSIKVDHINITGENAISTNGGTVQLSATATPDNAADKSVAWTSNDTNIATVNDSGLVTAKANGNVIITATAKDGSNASNTKSITITGQTTTTTGAAVSIKVTDINITGQNAISTKSGTVQLNATVAPDNADDKSVTWTSSDTNIATVNDNGLVTAKANGNVIITATAKDGSNVSKTKNITITGQTTTTTSQTTPTSASGIKVTGISISGENAISTKGGTVQLSAIVTPDNATNKSVTWSSSNTSIAVVSSTGVVTAKTDGSVTITATATDGSGVLGTKTIAVTGQTTSNSTDTNTSSSALKSVSISGTEEVGRTLKSKIKYDGTKPSVEYQWQRASSKNGDYSDISGAKDDSYKLKSSDKNKYIRLAVTTTINGNTYTVYDTTSRIDKSDNTEDDTTSSTSSNAGTSSNQSYNSYTPSMQGKSLIFTGEGPFMNPSGIPVRGWMSSGDKWYYLDNNGVAKTGWVSDKGNWYYLDPSVGSTHATMKTGWINDNGKWYYLNSSGAMLANTTVDGYYLGSDGAWV